MNQRDKIKAVDMSRQHDQRVTDSLKVKSGVKAGPITLTDILVSS